MNNRIKKILFLGDVTDKNGKAALEKYLPIVQQRYKCDFIVANGENAAQGARGYSNMCHELFMKIGIDVVTLGNHVFKNSTIIQIIGDKRIVRPANLITRLGHGYTIINKNGISYGIISIMGNDQMPQYCNNAFIVAKNIVKKIRNMCDFIMIDIHAKEHGEKYAFAHYMNGYVTAVLGTHTHIPTGDAQILSRGTAYMTDVGMCGSYSLIRGKPLSHAMNKYVHWKKHCDKQNLDSTLSGCIVYFDSNNFKATAIKPIIYGDTVYGAIKT